MKYSPVLRGVWFLLLFVAVFDAQAADSPFSRGSFNLAGGGTYMSLSSDDIRDDPSFFIFYPAMGYFISNNLCLGAQLVLASVSVGNDDVSAMGIGPQATYYFVRSGAAGGYSGRAVPYLTASILIGQVSDGPNDVTARAITVGGGVLAMMAKNIGGFAELNYNFDKLNEDSSPNDDEYSGGRVAIQVGLRLFIW